MNSQGSTTWIEPSGCDAWGGVGRSLPEVFAERVAEHGPRKAIGSGKWQPTYQQLHDASDRVRHFIQSRGGCAGDRVGLLMRHDAPLVAAMLGVLKSGRMVVALNPSDPAARLTQICSDADVSLLVTDGMHHAQALEVAAGPGGVMQFEDITEPAPADGVPVAPSPDAPAFLLYTSGSTGRPKGVIQTHRNILHTVRGYSVNFGLDASDRILLIGGLAGGQGVMTTFCALLNGATLHPYPLRELGVTPLPGWITRQKITVFISAASIFRQFARVVPADQTFPRVRLVRLGTEPVRISDWEIWRKLFAEECRFAAALSSTETGNLTLFLPDGTSGIQPDGVLPVGRPVAGKQLMILREDETEAQEGESGEIAVRSAYLSPGYWRDPETTQRAFRPIPGSDERFYLTGDVGRWRADGLLEYLGRKDQRIKVMGNRVDPGDIEAALGGHPSVAEVSVSATTDSSGRTQLLAWIVPRDSAAFDPRTFRESVHGLLPAAASFAQIIAVSEIPRTSNGKPDIGRLRAGLEPPAPAGTLEPRTGCERRIAHAWAEALGKDPASVYESFFEAGGDSLQAVDLMLALSKEFGQPLLPELLITCPSIAQLADVLEHGLVRGAPSPWLRLPAATLLPLREQGSACPLLFIPGGYGSENELLVCASLLTCIDADHPAYGVRLNLHARRVVPPFSLQVLARAIGRAWVRQHGGRMPVIIGECQACMLATETARWMTRKLGAPPRLVLLDPWQPRSAATALEAHPPAIRRYYTLLRRHHPAPYAGRVHLVCARESGRLQVCRDWWTSRLGSGCVASEVPGTHKSYIRAQKGHLATFLNDLLRQPDAGATAPADGGTP